MVRLMRVAAAAALLAFPLFAAEVKVMSADNKPEKKKKDSAIVAAAKAANRAGKKPAVVITNDNLAEMGAKAHLTTTTVQRPVELAPAVKPARPTPEMVHAQETKKARIEKEAAAKAKKLADDAAKARLAELNELVENDYLADEDPGLIEQKLTEAAAEKPPTP